MPTLAMPDNEEQKGEYKDYPLSFLKGGEYLEGEDEEPYEHSVHGDPLAHPLSGILGGADDLSYDDYLKDIEKLNPTKVKGVNKALKENRIKQIIKESL